MPDTTHSHSGDEPKPQGAFKRIDYAEDGAATVKVVPASAAAVAMAAGEPVKGKAAGAATGGDADESPVSDTNAAEAIESIERMRSRDRLQHVIDNDPRSTVKDAARRRLDALNQ